MSEKDMLNNVESFSALFYDREREGEKKESLSIGEDYCTFFSSWEGR